MNLFTGWYDSKLSADGKRECQRVAENLKMAGFNFDLAYTSELERTRTSLEIILNEINQEYVPVEHNWLLNERHYGALTGMNINETIARYSYEQVDYWANYYTLAPPAINPTHKYYIDIQNKFEDIVDNIPKSESFENLQTRVIYFWNNKITPNLKSGHEILIVTHEATLQAISKHLDDAAYNYSFTNTNFNVETPYFYEFDDDIKPIVKQRLA